MAKYILLLIFFTVNVYSQEGRLIPNPLRSIPRWVRQEFSAHKLNQDYTITFRLYPRYLRGDFNHDGIKDIVIQISEKRSGKEGIAIFQGKKTQVLNYTIVILGAGKHIANLGDDLRWADLWNDEKSDNHNVIRIEKRNLKRGIINWDGKNYIFSIK